MTKTRFKAQIQHTSQIGPRPKKKISTVARTKLGVYIGHIEVDDRCRVMFVGVVLVSPHETITRPLG